MGSHGIYIYSLYIYIHSIYRVYIYLVCWGLVRNQGCLKQYPRNIITVTQRWARSTPISRPKREKLGGKMRDDERWIIDLEVIVFLSFGFLFHLQMHPQFSGFIYPVYPTLGGESLDGCCLIHSRSQEKNNAAFITGGWVILQNSHLGIGCLV